MNESNASIMFKVKTTSQDSYYVRPNLGIVEPKQSRNVHFIFRRALGGPVSSQFLMLIIILGRRKSEKGQILSLTSSLRRLNGTKFDVLELILNN